MTLAEKTAKLLQHSLIIKTAEKKAWKEMLPRMSEKDIQVLYGVLVDEVKAWKKEGISIVQNLAEEATLLPEEPKPGASINALKDRLEGKVAPDQINNAQSVKVPEPTTAFGKELVREVNTPELPAPSGETETVAPAKEGALEPEFNEPEFKMPSPDKNAWMLSSRVVVPKPGLNVIRPKPLNVPKIRNRVPKHGLKDLQSLASLDDLAKVEAAHLRQGPMAEQIALLKTRIVQLAEENDMLPISVLPIFEQSPLYQTYLKAGIELIARNTGEEKVSLDDIEGEIEQTGSDALNQKEFEAVADLRKELESSAGM